MQIFLSWSGPESNDLASAFRDWIPQVHQNLVPFFSEEDLSRGGRWFGEVYKNLKECRGAIIFVTSKNMESAWMNFEAGASAMAFPESNKVCPLLFGLDSPSALKGPLTNFQASKFGRTEVLALLRQFNEDMVDGKLQDAVLAKSFDRWWPDLEGRIVAVTKESRVLSTESRRATNDVMDEILERTRATQDGMARPSRVEIIDDKISSLFLHTLDVMMRHHPTSWSDYAQMLEDIKSSAKILFMRLEQTGLEEARLLAKSARANFDNRLAYAHERALDGIDF